eukprot:m.17038 g.17038  ORF g.17038 m.17038 type:complete len:216 (+) comp3451_c0_seq1:448-1095(+)
MLLNVKATLAWGHVDKVFSVIIDEDATMSELHEAVCEAFELAHGRPLEVEYLTNGYGAQQPLGVPLNELFESGSWVLVKARADAPNTTVALTPTPTTPGAGTTTATKRRGRPLGKAKDATTEGAPPPAKRAKKGTGGTGTGSPLATAATTVAPAASAPTASTTTPTVSVRRSLGDKSAAPVKANPSMWCEPIVSLRRVVASAAAQGHSAVVGQLV